MEKFAILSLISMLQFASLHALECPFGTEAIGGLNADIGGCGLEGCDARYQDNYANIDECKVGCDNDAQCVSFSWAPLNGDKNHPGKTVCTLYNSDVPNQVWGPEQILCVALECPAGTEQIGNLNADIGGCGLEGCDARYQDNYSNINECKSACNDDTRCVSFSWAPLNGDRNHPGKTVCTLYNSKIPNQIWGPQQILCGLVCPAGTKQIGGLNADIAGCGLEGCDARYQDNYANINECNVGCDNDARCVSFSWAPLNGDRNHPGKTVCTLYCTDVPNQVWGPEQVLCAPALECPAGTEQIGDLNADIAGCGLEGCDARYQDNYVNIDECKQGCNDNAQCVSFSWAPFNGDRNHPGKTVCTLYNSRISNQIWGPKQILCELLECPSGTTQIGGLNADIGGCGLEGCNARYQDNYANIDECKAGCDNDARCVSFSWAPLNGDRNHPGKTVCTLYNSDVPNQVWGPEQILCA